MQSKASTISSGARAAAQTLNVPIERLEAQVHSGSKTGGSPLINHNEKSLRHHVEEINTNHAEHNGKGVTHSYQQQDIQKHHHHVHQQTHNTNVYHKNSLNNGTSANQELDAILHQDDHDEQMSSLPSSPANTKYSLLQFAMQYFREE